MSSGSLPPGAHQQPPQQQQQQAPLHPQFPPHQQPVYNGVNPNYPGVRMAANDSWTPAPVVGKGTGEISNARTSSTCYLAREDVPNMMRKIAALTGKPIEHCELPQVGRYLASQQYFQHFDAFNLDQDDGRRFAANGGQRTITVLIYLNNVAKGGETHFPRLNLSIQPVQGMALVFFPATVDGTLDTLALHAALPAIDPKYVSQIWIRQSSYFGQPSKRLAQTMGPPFSPTSMTAQPDPAIGNPILQQQQQQYPQQQ
eukprot:scaffold3596_cov126-Cylindrotheca_fusiformis.AAC.16